MPSASKRVKNKVSHHDNTSLLQYQPDANSIPPPPSDPEALRKTWEQVRLSITRTRLKSVPRRKKRLYLLSRLTDIPSLQVRQVLCQSVATANQLSFLHELQAAMDR